MAELKCPWQIVETTEVYENGGCQKTTKFADCVKLQCPFWMYGKYTAPVCYKAMSEAGKG